MRRLPKNMTNYVSIVEENRVYIDKTMFIEKMENLDDKAIMFLRPRKFGKTLFTSVLENYYDILKKDRFEELFGHTYIGKNPTENRNRYCILRFNFSGIDTETRKSAINGFRDKVKQGVRRFIDAYNINFDLEKERTAEGLIGDIFDTFKKQKPGEKIYVIIDEYDHFANELLGFRNEDFKSLVSKNGKVRKWYEVLKEGAESVVDRIFITGVAPITLDSTTSGFNIAFDITKDIRFNDMLGFCEKDVRKIMDSQEISKEEQERLMPIIRDNYDGYIFSDELYSDDYEKYRIYNSNMTLYFLNLYIDQGRIPEKLVDTNIISDYSKIEALMNLCKKERKKEILEKIVAKEKVEAKLTEKYNQDIKFGEDELISLLFYLGYLTISGKGYSKIIFNYPNEVIRQIYVEYFLKYISDMAKIETYEIDTELINKEILEEGRIDAAIEILGRYLTSLSNRDYQRFDEKYVKIIFYTICKMLGAVFVKSELEISGKYSDVLIIPREKIDERYGVLVEFKYIKNEDYEKDKTLLEKNKTEARGQIEKYKQTEEIKLIPKIRCYTVVAVKDKLYVEEI